MGYETRYGLEFNQNTEAGARVAAFLEYSDLKHKPLTAIRRKYPDVTKYLDEMETLDEKFRELVLKEKLADGDEAVDMIQGAWTGGLDACKWYGHEGDMRVFSRLFPEVLFMLSGEGEESGDIWRKYFKDGKVQKAKAQITFEPFDPAKLA